MKPTAKQQAENLMCKASVMARALDQVYEKTEAASGEARQHAEAAESAKKFCNLVAESMHRCYVRDIWWKVLLLAALGINIALETFVLLRT